MYFEMNTQMPQKQASKNVSVTPPISAIMVSYFTGPVLEKSINAILADKSIRELLIIDNGNSIQARQALAGQISGHSKVRIVQGHGNVGFAKASNYGASLAEGELFLFINPDAIIAKHAVQAMAECGADLKMPWIVGALLANENGSEQRGARRDALTLKSAVITFLHLHRFPGVRPVHREGDPLPERAVPMPVVSGACMLMSRHSFEKLGGFDEGYFLHVEDIDICERARRLGGAVYFQPAAKVMHYGSTSQVPRLKVEWAKVKGFIHYFHKFAPSPARRLLVWIFAPFMTAAILGRMSWLSLRQALGRH